VTRRLVAIVAACCLAGCMAGPDYRRPDVTLPGQFPEMSDAATRASAAVPAQWWHLYNDPLLDELVDSALTSNADVAQALARIDEARAVLRAANASFFPELDLGANAGRQALSNASPTPRVVSGYAFTLSTNYEIDFWGRLRRNSESARYALLSSEYAHDVVTLSVASSTTQAYFTLRTLDALIVVTRETLRAFDDTLALTRRRAEGGVASDLDVRQAEAQRQLARVALTDLIRQRAAVLHQLQVLTARLDLDVAPGDLRTLPVPVEPPPGLPSSLLERRPDVRQAEAALAAQNARIGVARAAMFPTISLTGDYGGSSASLGNCSPRPGASGRSASGSRSRCSTRGGVRRLRSSRKRARARPSARTRRPRRARSTTCRMRSPTCANSRRPRRMCGCASRPPRRHCGSRSGATTADTRDSSRC
jgi:multidrug efflux system outer membrane protein